MNITFTPRTKLLFILLVVATWHVVLERYLSPIILQPIYIEAPSKYPMS